MAESSVGTATLKLTGDTTGLEVALDRARQSQAGLGASAEQEAARMTRAQRRVIETLQRQADTTGLTREQLLQYNIVTRTTGDVQAALLNRLRANTAELDKQSNATVRATSTLNQYGQSAKQTAAALRGVPAQVTDIVVSLQGGQNPLTVLLQQGGQLKDMFGGVVPAARALGSTIAGLVNPATVAAVAIGGIGFAFYSGEQRANEFNRALLLTGNASGATANSLNAMALQLDNISGVTARQAASALTAVVSTGKIAEGQYQLVAQAAAMMEDAVGKAMSETVAEYAELARDPVNAVLRLNETEHFLTQSVYDRIRAMQDAGDIEGAAALATEARATAQIERAREVVDSLGLISGAWHAIKENTGEAWDEAVNYFAEVDKSAKQSVNSLKEFWNAMSSGVTSPWGLVNAANGAGTAATTGRPQPQAGADAKVNSAAQRQLDTLLAGNRSREERQKLEETQIVNLYRQLGISKEDKRVQDALTESQKRYKESLPKASGGASAARGLANASAQASLQLIKNAEEAQRTEIANTSKVLQANYAARNVSAADYYAQQRELMSRDFAAQEDSLTKQIEYLRSRDLTGKDSVNTNRELTQLETKLAKVRADSATQLVILGVQEKDVNDKRVRAIDAYKDSLNTSLESSKQQADAQVARIMLSEREFSLQSQLASITEKAAQEQRKLAKELAETNDRGAYDEKLQLLRDYTDEQVRIVVEGYARMDEAQRDWLNGFRTGVADWTANAANVADQAKQITTRALDGTVDMLTNFAMTGKLVWKDLLRDIGEEIARFMIKKAVLQFVNLFTSMWGGGVDAGGYSGNGTGAGSVQGFGNNLDNFTKNAKGNVYSSPSLSAYSGQVVNQPTPFYFAKGAGVMGEAGPEGIFPLSRGSDGKLGLKVAGGGMGTVTVETNVYVSSDGSSRTETSTAGGQAQLLKDLAGLISTGAQQQITKAMMPGGQLWKAGYGARN